MTELMISLAAVVAVCGAWQLYQHRRRESQLRMLMSGTHDPAAVPPAAAVPVESALVQRLFATRAWHETRTLLADDFVMVLPDGRRVGEQALELSTAALEDRYENPHATVEGVFADLERPSVLYVHSAARLRPWRGEAFDTDTWTRLTVAPCGTRIRELGPTSVVASAGTS
jgi:hypothetical protein